VLAWLSVWSEVQTCIYGPLTVSCFSKIQTGFTCWYRLTWVVPEKGQLNGCVCVCVCVSMYIGLRSAAARACTRSINSALFARGQDRCGAAGLCNWLSVDTGLCGSYDGNPHNDLTLRNGSLYSTWTGFHPWSFPADYCADWRYANYCE